METHMRLRTHLRKALNSYHGAKYLRQNLQIQIKHTFLCHTHLSPTSCSFRGNETEWGARDGNFTLCVQFLTCLHSNLDPFRRGFTKSKCKTIKLVTLLDLATPAARLQGLLVLCTSVPHSHLVPRLMHLQNIDSHG